MDKQVGYRGRMGTTEQATVSFYGAARGVTGSCYVVRAAGGEIAIDCGIFQGEGDPDKKNRAPFPFDPSKLDGLVFTHGHLDHVGRSPRLVENGFRGVVTGHPATLEIAQLVMEDTARIATFSGSTPIYSDDAVTEFLGMARPARGYGDTVTVGPFRVRFYDAGHILGSSSVRVAWDEAGGERAILFSGDLGVLHTPIIRDPHTAWDENDDVVDAVITESTYGSRAHPDRLAARQTFRDAVMHAVSDGGKVLIPAFAIGRTQELLYELNHLVENNELRGVPVIVDGPMGLDATKLYARHRGLYDEEALELLRGGDDPLEFQGLFAARHGRASAAAKDIDGPAVIIAGSGMCSGGRIRGYLAEYLADPTTDVIFVGYQAKGTLGRDLQGGKDEVSIDGRTIEVRAAINTISGFSAHADQDGLAEWFGRVPLKPGGSVFVTHGEEESSRDYARHLKDRFGARAILPAENDTAAIL